MLQLEYMPEGARVSIKHFLSKLLVVAIGADILIPARDTGSLALLLPWGITYWLHHVIPAKKE